MDVLLQTHEAKRVFPVPEGLKELASDIVREVLRHQPECIHAFVAEYLETMLIVREKARDSTVVVSDIFRQGYFFEDLYRTKKVTREDANMYASVIQAAWRGYVVRKKLKMYLEKKRKIEEEREMRKALKIEEFLESIGITYDEATRAACVIQAAFRQSRRGRWVLNDQGEEVWMEGEAVPIGQRVREADRAHGRFDRWDKEDFGDFFELDEEGEIVYDWPRCGQLRKIPRVCLRPDMDVVEFFAMRDLQGREQYSYLKTPQKGRDPRGFPIGFLIPLPRECIQYDAIEVAFVNPMSSLRMGTYSYIFEKTIERQDLHHIADVLKARKLAKSKINANLEIQGEFDYDPDWVVPRIMIQIRKDCLREKDDEVAFLKMKEAPAIDDNYTFRAEAAETSLKVINHLLKMKCLTVEEALADASNIVEYKPRSTGRFLPVENFTHPRHIQKVIIVPETRTGEYESDNMDNYEYIFVPKNYRWRIRVPPPDNPIEIPITRFQGYHSDYRGTCGLQNQVFIMGPMLHTPDGKPFTFESLFWDDFGPEAWYQLLCKIANKKIAHLGEAILEEEDICEDLQDEISVSEISKETRKAELPGEMDVAETAKTEFTDAVFPEEGWESTRGRVGSPPPEEPPPPPPLHPEEPEQPPVETEAQEVEEETRADDEAPRTEEEEEEPPPPQPTQTEEGAEEAPAETEPEPQPPAEPRSEQAQEETQG